MNSNEQSGGGNQFTGGEVMPLLRSEEATSTRTSQSSQQQQQQHNEVMAQYGNNMAAYAMAAAQYEAAAAAAGGGVDYGYGAMAAPGQPPMQPAPGSPYGYYPASYMYPSQPGPPPQGYYAGPPGAAGGAPHPPSPQQGMPYYPSSYPTQSNPGQPPPPPPPLNPAPSSRPPRATRRSGKLSPSPTNQFKKKYDEQHIPGMSAPGSDMEDPQQGSSSIPPLKDIFSPGDLTSGMDGSGMGYGATSSGNNKIWNAPKQSDSPKIRGSGSKSPRVPPRLIRTSSSGELQSDKPAAGPGNAAKPRRGHRRSNSDTPLRLMRHRRLASNEQILPPIAGKKSSLSANNSLSGDPGNNRHRSYSAGGSHGGSRPPGARHRRADSMSSVNTYTSNASVGSVVSNIAKSAMFGGVTEKGTVQLHKPFECVRLVMMNPDKKYMKKYNGEQNGGHNNRIMSSMSGEELDMEEGKLYMESRFTDADKFDDYHRITNDIQEGLQPNWESLEREELICSCPCNNCNGCTGKAQLLPPTTYALAVRDDVYKRVVSEISDAQGMPCGLFFCGHHEDVSHPSIFIAVALVSLLFLSMALIAFYF